MVHSVMVVFGNVQGQAVGINDVVQPNRFADHRLQGRGFAIGDNQRSGNYRRSAVTGSCSYVLESTAKVCGFK